MAGSNLPEEHTEDTPLTRGFPQLEMISLANPFGAGYLWYVPTVGSTMDLARELAGAGAPPGTVVLAGAQTRGRGRPSSGKSPWISPPGQSLSMTLILDADVTPAPLSLRAGLGVCRYIEEVWHLPARIKWPNDIYLAGRKVGGILVESEKNRMYLGIGVNLLGSVRLSSPGPGRSGTDPEAISLEEARGLFPRPATRTSTEIPGEASEGGSDETLDETSRRGPDTASAHRLSVPYLTAQVVQPILTYLFEAQHDRKWLAGVGFRLLYKNEGVTIGAHTGVFRGLSGDGAARLEVGPNREILVRSGSLRPRS